MYCRRRTLLLLGAFLCSACQPHRTIVDQQTAALTLDSSNVALRQVQSRRFDTDNERDILQACAAVLQDLGFTIDESSVKTGLVVASKDRDAVESGQVAGQLVLAALVAALGGQADPVWERNQKIRISVVTKPLPNKTVLVRVTFQRVIWNTRNQISRIETINDPRIHQEFFDKLSQSVFLEAHHI